MNPLTNPVYRARTAAQLSQAKFARICGVTPQVILRCEQGTINLIPPKVLRPVADELSLASRRVEEQYDKWREAKRKENAAVVLHNVMGVNREMSYKEFRTAVAGSVAGFCKLILVNPVIWTRLEREGGNREFFDDALKEMGIDWIGAYIKGTE